MVAYSKSQKPKRNSQRETYPKHSSQLLLTFELSRFEICIPFFPKIWKNFPYIQDFALLLRGGTHICDRILNHCNFIETCSFWMNGSALKRYWSETFKNDIYKFKKYVFNSSRSTEVIVQWQKNKYQILFHTPGLF